MRRIRLNLVAVAALLAAAGQVQAEFVTVYQSSVLVDARHGDSGSVAEWDTSTALNRTNTLSVSTGSSSSVLNLDWQEFDGGAFFDFEFDHVRDGSQLSYARAYETVLQFTVSEDTTYSLSGYYDVSDTGPSDPGYVRTDIALQDSSGYLFRDADWSDSTANASFVVGQDDDGSGITGSRSGSLYAGHIYRFWFQKYIHASSDPDSGASAHGEMRLTIGEAAAVPVPASVVMIGTGLLSFLGCGWRRRELLFG